MKKVFFCLAAAVSLFLISCDIGLGEVVDIDAPELSVTRMISGGSEKTNFGTTLYTRKNVTFKGTAWDNTGVENVHAEVKWLGDEDYSYLKNASVSGGEWSLDVSFPKEGACWLKIVSEDKKKNYGSKSAKVISLFVDEKAPVGEAWYIDRLVSGIQYSLQSKETLEAIIEKDPELLQPANIDVAQNVEFKICSSFSDASGINSVSISIWNESGNQIGEVAKTSESSNYAPQFLINSTNVPSLPSTGRHYLQVRYSADDIVTDPTANSVQNAEIEMGWFIWWPESDNPRCYISQEDSSHSIKLHINDAVNVTVFDDDGFKSANKIECILYEADGTTISTYKDKNGITKERKYVKTPEDGERECNIIVEAPGDAQTMVLKVNAKDKYDKVLAKSNSVLVTDENHPTIIVTTPENNQVPNVTGATSDINFKGIALDSSGCTNLKFIWVPDSVSDKKVKALAWMNDDSSAAPSQNLEKKTGTGNYAGMKLYNVKLSTPVDESGLKKQTFDFKLSLTGDFETDTNKDKYFYIRLIRKDGNYTDSEIKIAADNIKPELKLDSPSGNMAIIDKDTAGGIQLTFHAEKSTGVAIDSSKYKIEYIDPTGSATALSGSYDSTNKVYKSATIDSTTLTGFYDSGKNPRYKFYAEDILGNKTDGTYEFIISSLPQIDSINSSAPNLCKAGDDILINVSFTKPVSLSSTSGVKLKLANIKNNGNAVTREADYADGSGSTTLVFKYTVQPGDTSDGLQVNNESGVGPIKGIAETTAHLKVLGAGENLQDKKTIKLDGIAPTVSSITLSTDAAAANKNGGKDYLKEGKTVTATVSVGKKVTVQGTPTFKLGGIDLVWQSITHPTASSSVITFSKKIAAGDPNGEFTYTSTSCVDGLEYIKDDAGNALKNALARAATDTVVVDTKKPATPTVENAVTNVGLASGKYMSQVRFKIANVVQSGDPEIKAEYSLNGGTTWTDYSDFGTTSSTAPAYKEIKATSSVVNANLVTRITDRAGNVSKYSDPVSLEVNNAFPAYTVECINADKYYKSGKLTFKVYFASSVNIASTSNAYITLSGNGASDAFGSTIHNAVITADSKGDNKSVATFEYTIQGGDTFTLKVAKDAVHLVGVTDTYGFTQNGLELKEDYSRPKLKCDTIPPKVVKMTPAWRNGGTNKRRIDLEFSEDVNVNTGKIYVRQTNGWAIPPVLEVKDFNKIINAVKDANISIGSMTGTSILYMDGAEDSGVASGSKDNRKTARNNKYYGTGQFIGPYKKSSHGIISGKPDTTSKYVLAYDLSVWGNDGAKFGNTYNANGTLIEAANTITTDNIRQVLESIHFHERYMSVNSSSVVVDPDDKTKVTINLPNGFLGDEDLPKGREWELVIEKGAFMDETGNFFGYETDGTLGMSDSRQATNSKTDTTTSGWARKRDSVAVTDAIKPLVLIQDGENASFRSSGVETPVIRVDRYSFGIGMKQPSLSNSRIVNTAIADANNDTTTIPTGLVRVKIECETPNAQIYYTEGKYSNYFNYDASKVPQANTTNHGDIKAGLTPNLNPGTINYYKADLNITGNDGDKCHCFSYWTETGSPTVADPTKTGSGSTSVEFLGGNGSYSQSCKQIIKAKAWLDSDSSDVGQEGVFQTVLHIVDPYDGGLNKISVKNSGKKDFSVRGTTGWAGEPSITPFPLRDAVPGTPYLRRTYRNGDNYYWVSYEILVGSSFSGHCSDGGNYDWCRNWGYSEPGEFTRCINMERW